MLSRVSGSAITSSSSGFKANYPLGSRQEESERIRTKYPDRIPVICEKSASSTDDIPHIDKIKYLVPSSLTVGQFIYVIRKRIQLPAEKAMFIFINNSIPPTSALMSTLYETDVDVDGFLYCTYTGESTFGNTFKNDSNRLPRSKKCF